jgi:outer membrane cobalamin receptor
MSLRQHLNRISGVTVRGDQENTKILIRANGSLQHNRGKQPLFVVDGQKMGRSFYYVSSQLDPKEIISVEVLRGAGANMYGSQGGRGVIVIETTRDN